MDTAELRAATVRLQEMIGLREPPLALYYTDAEPQGHRSSGEGWSCVIGVMSRARRGETVYYDKDHIGCDGGGYYLGFCPPRPGVAEFVSQGIPGEMEGERYKKAPELMRSIMESYPPIPAPARYAVVQPVSTMADAEEPLLVICFARPDEMAGLVFLANYARHEDATISPFCSGCGALVSRPLLEAQNEQPRAVLGIFDPSARPFLPEDLLSFSAPMALWAEMLQNADESFLTTDTWAKVRKRIERTE